MQTTTLVLIAMKTLGISMAEAMKVVAQAAASANTRL